MKIPISICIVVSVSLPITMALNCYQCAAGSRGCSDPFNKTGSGVSTTGTNNSYAYCKKQVFVGVALRTGEMKCEDSKFILNSGTTCCQTDLCNRATIHFQIPIIFIINFLIIFAKIQFA